MRPYWETLESIERRHREGSGEEFDATVTDWQGTANVRHRDRGRLLEIVAAQAAEVDRLRAAEARVRELHVKVTSLQGDSYCNECMDCTDPDNPLWPCATIRALGATDA